jgi:hypothetical protein
LQGTFGAAIYNNPGVDILIFESGDPPTAPGNYSNNQYELVSASLTGANGTWIDASILGFLAQNQLGGTSTSFGTYVYGIDLSNLGVAEGASISSLFFGNTCGASCAGGGNNPDVVWIGGVAGADAAAAPETTPLPTALPMFLSGVFGVGGLLRWRKRKAIRALS